jgi:electron transfer flavoprotein beta subunit
VVACLAPCDLRPAVDLLTGDVWVDPRRADLSPPDAAALEHALRAAEVWGGRVLAVAAGGASVEPVLREAVALGADAVRVKWGEETPGASGPARQDPEALAADPSALAAALAGAIRSTAGPGSPALVVCGDRSAARGVGAVPAVLAHHLGAAQALGLVALRADESEVGTVIAERRLDGGWRERLRVRGPAVCSVEAAGVRLRRAPLPEVLAAGERVIAVVGGGASGPAGAHGRGPLHVGAPRPYRPRTKVVAAPAGGTHERLLALTGALAAHDPPRIVGPLDAATAADELLEYLVRHGYGPAAER